MPKRTDLKKILLIGSGPIIIGQACECIYAAGEPLTTMRVWKGKQDEVGLARKRDLYVTSQRGHASSVKAEFELPETLIAPLAKNKPVGKAKVVVDGQTIATYDLFPNADVPAAGFFGRAWDSLRLLFH